MIGGQFADFVAVPGDFSGFGADEVEQRGCGVDVLGLTKAGEGLSRFGLLLLSFVAFLGFGFDLGC